MGEFKYILPGRFFTVTGDNPDEIRNITIVDYLMFDWIETPDLIPLI